jgi:hypothetical protein
MFTTGEGANGTCDHCHTHFAGSYGCITVAPKRTTTSANTFKDNICIDCLTANLGRLHLRNTWYYLQPQRHFIFSTFSSHRHWCWWPSWHMCRQDMTAASASCATIILLLLSFSRLLYHTCEDGSLIDNSVKKSMTFALFRTLRPQIKKWIIIAWHVIFCTEHNQ